jgi:hypothetical protein
MLRQILPPTLNNNIIIIIAENKFKTIIILKTLSHLLTKTGCGFKMKQNETFRHSTSHLLYMGDLKLYVSTDHQLKQLISVTEAFSINTKYNLILINVKLDVYTEKKSVPRVPTTVWWYHPTTVWW